MRQSGFALIEAAVLTVLIACLAALILLLGADHRRQGHLGEDIGKLRRIGALTAQYGADNADMFWTFSWKKGQSLSQYPDLNNATDDLQAGANQAVDILRRKAGREDIPRITSWFSHAMYSHLSLADYTGLVPDSLFISAADVNRLKWSRDPLGFDAGVYLPAPSGAPGSSAGKRWPYGSSFQFEAAFYDKGLPPNRVAQGGDYRSYIVPGSAVIGGRSLADATFPSHKVHVHDINARHFGPKQPYCTQIQARLPLLFVDGAVSVRAAAESNPGWQPNTPTSSANTIFSYAPEAWEPATYIGSGAEIVYGLFRWTRSGVGGRDFGGPEVCSGQPGCP